MTLNWGEELVSLCQYEDHVSLLLRSEHGSQRELPARWVIGCDGAASTVRQLLNIDLEDLEFNEPWLVVDVLLNEAGVAKAPAVPSVRLPRCTG